MTIDIALNRRFAGLGTLTHASEQKHPNRNGTIQVVGGVCTIHHPSSLDVTPVRPTVPKITSVGIEINLSMPRRSASPSAGRSRRDDSDDERRKRHRDRDRSRSPSRRESKKDKKRSKDEEEEEEERTVESLESAGVTEIGSDDYL